MKPGSEPSGCCSEVRSCVPIFHCWTEEGVGGMGTSATAQH